MLTGRTTAKVRARRAVVRLLARRPLTQQSLARELGVSQATVSRDLAALGICPRCKQRTT
jgi:predicted DNA-binding transcriptional regulator YafY